MRGSLFRKLAIAILSMDLSEAELRELEGLLKDKSRVQGLLDACRAMQRVLGVELGKARLVPVDHKLTGDSGTGKLCDAVAASPDLTIRQLSEIVEWACGRGVQPGKKTSKAEFVRKLSRQLSREEIHRVAQKLMETPHSGEGEGVDEWFQQMSRRVHGER